MNTALPKKLNKEPLLDAIFELRFQSLVPASVVLPGFLFNELEGDKAIESLPVAQIPKNIRDNDPNLKFQPLTRVDWGQFFLSISDFSISVGCKYPYPGWAALKPAITNVINVVEKSRLITAIERYSLKYIDLLPGVDLREKVSMINLDVSLAGHKLVREPFHIRVEIPRDGFTNAVQVVSSAQATLNTGLVKEGMIVDVDTWTTFKHIPMEALLKDFSNKLDLIHQTNKAVFFDCITRATLQTLEPIYE